MIASVTGLFSQFSLESGASAAALKGTGGLNLIWPRNLFIVAHEDTIHWSLSLVWWISSQSLNWILDTVHYIHTWIQIYIYTHRYIYCRYLHLSTVHQFYSIFGRCPHITPKIDTLIVIPEFTLSINFMDAASFLASTLNQQSADSDRNPW